MLLSIRNEVFRVFNCHRSPSLWCSPCSEWHSIRDQSRQTAFLPFPPEKKAHLGGRRRTLITYNPPKFLLPRATGLLNCHGVPPPTPPTGSPWDHKAGTSRQFRGSKGRLLYPWQVLELFFPCRYHNSIWQNQLLQPEQQEDVKTSWMRLFIDLNG